MAHLAIHNTRWLIDDAPVNAGSPAEGLLVNVRMVNSVTLSAGDTAIGRRDDAPWQFTWSGAPSGTHDLVAIVHNASDAEVARSRAVDIVVR